MSKQRNKSGGPLDVPLLGRVVEDGEVADCPDFQPAHNPDSKPGDPDYLAITWPPDKWEEVPEPKVEPELPKRIKALPAPPPDPAPAGDTPEDTRQADPPAPGPEPVAAPVSSDPRER